MKLHALRFKLLLVALLVSCTSAPPHAIRTALGEVRANSMAEARHVAERSGSLREELLELIPDSKPAKADVWVHTDEVFEEKFAGGGISGLVVWKFPGHLLGGTPRIELPTTSMEHSLAHEWVHILLGPSWDALSGAIEEGLANELASRLTPALERDRLRFGYLCAALGEPWPEEIYSFTSQSGRKIRVRRKEANVEYIGPELSLLEVLAEPKIRKKSVAKRPGAIRLYGLGTLLAERILARPDGLRALHEACAKVERGGKVPPMTLVRLAGFEGEADLKAWLRAEREEGAAGALLLQPRSYASLVAELERLTERKLDRDAVLEEMNPTCRVLDSKEIEIGEDPRLRQLFLENWPTREQVDAMTIKLAEKRAQALSAS